MTFCVTFEVLGAPRPKQSFRYSKKGNWIYPRVREWQTNVRESARVAMGHDNEPYSDKIFCTIHFRLPDKIKRDLDNLSKGVLDAMNKVVFVDDRQIVCLVLSKEIDRDNPGAYIVVMGVNDLEAK